MQESLMDLSHPHPLEARSLFPIADAGAVQVRCIAGTLWLTLDHDPRDIILQPGDSFSAADARPGLLYALEPALFALLPLPQASSRRRLPKNSSDCSRSPPAWAATRAASSGATGCSGRPVECASTCAMQARSR
jgi:hypothetical protein